MVGAIPPLMGWAATKGDLSAVEPWLVVSTIHKRHFSDQNQTVLIVISFVLGVVTVPMAVSTFLRARMAISA